MSVVFQWPLPKWVKDLPPESQDKAKNEFYLTLAALYLDRSHSDVALATKLNRGKATVGVWKTRGVTPGECAVELENLLGRDLFPRALFRPDLFNTAE